MKIEAYRLVENPTKVLYVGYYPNGFLFILKYPRDRDNTWISIEEIELSLGTKFLRPPLLVKEDTNKDNSLLK